MEAGGVCLPSADSAGGGTGTFPIAGSEGEDGDGIIPTGRAGVI